MFNALENLKAIKLAIRLLRMAQLSLLTSIWSKISFDFQCSGSGKRQEYMRGASLSDTLCSCKIWMLKKYCMQNIDAHERPTPDKLPSTRTHTFLLGKKIYHKKKKKRNVCTIAYVNLKRWRLLRSITVYFCSLCFIIKPNTYLFVCLRVCSLIFLFSRLRAFISFVYLFCILPP